MLFKKIRSFFDALAEGEAKARAKIAVWQQKFPAFLSECGNEAPYAPSHQEAALYRYAWRRSKVLIEIHEKLENSAEAEQYNWFACEARRRYARVKPYNMNGEIKLEITPKQIKEFMKRELERMNPRKATSPAKPSASIYLGQCQDGLVYIGQTTAFPENRWFQHRMDRTGPFKKGAPFVTWKILEGPVEDSDLDSRESYFIGLYDAFEHGHNDTRGNHLQSYQRGQDDRRKSKRTIT